MGASISIAARGIEAQLEGMIKRANLVPGYLNRVVYRQYQVAQRTRWESENSGTEYLGGTWDRLSIPYAERKMRDYYDASGKGTKILFASGNLFRGVVGPAIGHKKLVTGRSIVIATTVPYAKYVDEKRTFTRWSPVFYRKVLKGLSDYLVKNIVRDIAS